MCNLRLSSREIAVIAKPAHLPQSFWASRFAAEKEMNFFPLDEYLSASPNSKTDWRFLYARIRHTLQDKTVKGYLRSRRRVWQCVGHITQCLVPLLEQAQIRRTASSLEPELTSQGYQVGQEAQGVDRERPLVPRGLGTFLFGIHSLIFRGIGYEAKTIQISVSFITFDCVQVVSGMRVFERPGADSMMELSRVGVIMPYCEESITLASNTQMMSIQVASSISGIVGLGLLLQDGDGSTIQRAVGTVSDPPDGVGIATLRPRTGHELSGFLIGLDVSNYLSDLLVDSHHWVLKACKFVSLQLLELRIDSGLSKSGLTDHTPTRPWYWHPAEPDPSDIATSFHMPEREKRLPIPTFALDMNFGGTDGSQLSRLNRIAAFHDDWRGFFLGFAFFYTNGTKKSFGMTDILGSANKRRTCIEQSIALDGPGGERIVRVGFVCPDIHSQVIKVRFMDLGGLCKRGN